MGYKNWIIEIVRDLNGGYLYKAWRLNDDGKIRLMITDNGPYVGPESAHESVKVMIDTIEQNIEL